ncbi:hypothetical protein BX666DRAFT_417670 [Dichotomocladium elegans]|nr:hypothetical protein BX666DRAFT_417670 [Dichotomocladium elegans]
MAAMSRQRSYSTRRSPPQSPLHRALSTATSDQRRPSSNSNRASVLLSEKQVNKINKKIANIRHNSLALSSPQLSAISTDLDLNDASFISTQSRRSALDNNTHESMASFPTRIQEFAVIEDLLFVLMWNDYQNHLSKWT